MAPLQGSAGSPDPRDATTGAQQGEGSADAARMKESSRVELNCGWQANTRN
jgi:hypothetical protein